MKKFFDILGCIFGIGIFVLILGNGCWFAEKHNQHQQPVTDIRTNTPLIKP